MVILHYNKTGKLSVKMLKVEMQINITYNRGDRIHVDNDSSPLSLPQWGSGLINSRIQNLTHFVVMLILSVFCVSIFSEPITKVKHKDSSRQVVKLLVFPTFRPKTYPFFDAKGIWHSSLIQGNQRFRGYLISISHKNI